MYDKIKIWVDRSNVEGQYLDILKHLESVVTSTPEEVRDARYKGYFEGFSVYVSIRGISIVGSLAKYLYGTNLQTLTRATTKDAIDKLSDSLHLDIGNSKITSLEFGTQFSMSKPADQYLSLLGDVTRLNRIQFTDDTLYYQSQGKKHYKNHRFYNKTKEVIADKRVLLPPCYADSNLLRYELSFSIDLPRQLKVNKVTGATLYDETFYRSMQDRYLAFYTSINKKNCLKDNAMSEIKTVSDGYNLLMSRFIFKSDHNEVESYLKELKSNKVFRDSKYYSLLKKKLREVASKSSITESNELITELDNEVKKVSIYQ